MNETEYLLTTLSEECAEVSQRACKALRFGLTEVQPGQQENNVRRIERELGDLMAVVELLGLRVWDEDKAAKREKLKKYMGYSREVGILEKPKEETEDMSRGARKLLEEFIQNTAVCQALAPTCIGGHQEDPCKCLYCRTRQQLSVMD